MSRFKNTERFYCTLDDIKDQRVLLFTTKILADQWIVMPIQISRNSGATKGNSACCEGKKFHIYLPAYSFALSLEDWIAFFTLTQAN